MIDIFYIDNEGGGYADHLTISENTTIGEFLEDRHTGHAADYLIRVNRQHAPKDYVLQDGDHVTITPLKQEGAAI